MNELWRKSRRLLKIRNFRDSNFSANFYEKKCQHPACCMNFHRIKKKIITLSALALVSSALFGGQDDMKIATLSSVSNIETAARFDFDNAEGVTLCKGVRIDTESPFSGNGSLVIVGDGSYKYQAFPLILKPNTKYRITGMAKREGLAPGSDGHAAFCVVVTDARSALHVAAKCGENMPRQ